MFGQALIFFFSLTTLKKNLQNFMVLLLLSASVKRFSVSCMQGFSCKLNDCKEVGHIRPYTNSFVHHREWQGGPEPPQERCTREIASSARSWWQSTGVSLGNLAGCIEQEFCLKPELEPSAKPDICPSLARKSHFLPSPKRA